MIHSKRPPRFPLSSLWPDSSLRPRQNDSIGAEPSPLRDWLRKRVTNTWSACGQSSSSRMRRGRAGP